MPDRDDREEIRTLIELRMKRLFGEERANANRPEIAAAASAIERVNRQRPEEFSHLDPERRSE